MTENEHPAGTWPAGCTGESGCTPNVPPAADSWPQRLTAQLAERQRRRTARAQIRATMAAARTAGLAARHAAKLARIRAEDRP